MGHCLLSQLHSRVIFHSPPYDCFHSIPSFLLGFEHFLIQDRKKKILCPLQTSEQYQNHVWLVARSLKFSGKVLLYVFMCPCT